MEKLISISNTLNLVNLGYSPLSKICQIQTTKTKIFLFLSSNDLLIYDISTSKPKHHHFCSKVTKIFTFQEKFFFLRGKEIILFNANNLTEVEKIDLRENVYDISFIDTLKTFSLIYVTENNEIKFMNKNRMTEVKKLYKEMSPIKKIIYQDNILLWVTKQFLKVFNLQSKIMLLKKEFQANNISNNEDVSVDCYLYNNVLCIIYNKENLFVYYLTVNNNDQSNSSNKKTYEICNVRSNINVKEYFIGVWVNLAVTKISILSVRNNCLNLDICKLDANKNNNNQDNSNKSISNIYFNKKFQYVNFDNINEIHYFFNSLNMYLYNKNELFVITVEEKDKFFFDNFNEKTSKIYFDNGYLIKNFNDMSLNKKIFILIRSLELNLIDEAISIDEYKLLYNNLLNIDIGNNNENNDMNASLGFITKIYNNYILYLLKINFKYFDKVYFIIKNNFNDLLTTKTKEKIIEILIKNSQFLLLKNFINNDVKSIELSHSLLKTINLLKNSKNNSEIIVKEIMYIEALLYQKNSNYHHALKLFIKINAINEIYNIVLNINEKLLFEYDILFELLDEYKLLNILDSLYTKLFRDICVTFYKKLFSLCSEIKISKFAFNLIKKEEYRLLLDNTIIEKLFNISIKNNDIVKIVNIYDRNKNDNLIYLSKFIKEAFNIYNTDGKKVIEENIEYLTKKENIEIYILLLANIKDYKKIIDIYIDDIEQPEKCIKFIENSFLNNNIKQDIYNYLSNKINKNNKLSNAKKFYYIMQFQDDITINKPELLDMLNEKDSKNKDNDDIKYVLLILKELNIKLSTLNTSKEMCSNLINKNFSDLKKNLKRGITFSAGKKECDFDECDNKNFLPGNNLVIFKNCEHSFHKECFQIIKDMYCFEIDNCKDDNDEKKEIKEKNFCPKCFGII